MHRAVFTFDDAHDRVSGFGVVTASGPTAHVGEPAAVGREGEIAACARPARSTLRTSPPRVDQRQFVRWLANATTSLAGEATSSVMRPMSSVGDGSSLRRRGSPAEPRSARARRRRHADEALAVVQPLTLGASARRCRRRAEPRLLPTAASCSGGRARPAPSALPSGLGAKFRGIRRRRRSGARSCGAVDGV